MFGGLFLRILNREAVSDPYLAMVKGDISAFCRYLDHREAERAKLKAIEEAGFRVRGTVLDNTHVGTVQVEPHPARIPWHVWVTHLPAEGGVLMVRWDHQPEFPHAMLLRNLEPLEAPGAERAIRN